MMRAHATEKRPRGGHRWASLGTRAYLESLAALYGSRMPGRLPESWRDRLPDPARYYGQHVAKLGRPNAAGWAQGKCPFHEDRNASLSVQVNDAGGGWRCFAGCGGGDLVAFHMRATGKSFREAVRELLGARA